MAAYSRDIRQVMSWTMPQLRLLGRYRAIRERNERRWELALASGMMSQEASETLWAQLGDDEEEGEYTGVIATGTVTSGGNSHSNHTVDSKGNVRAPNAPLLSDIALGKATAPPLIPITSIEKSKRKEENG